MELITQSIAAAAVGKGIELAYSEVKKALTKSKELATQRAINEQADLIRILDKKIKKLNKKLREVMNKNLQDPDTYLIFNLALKGAYQYSDPLKSEVLADMIWARLMSENPENIENQLVNDCISKIEKLSTNELNILAIAYLLELSEDYESDSLFEIDHYEEWEKGTIQDKYFLERNTIDISNRIEKFECLTDVQMSDQSVYFLKSTGLADLRDYENSGTNFILHNSFEPSFRKFPKAKDLGLKEYYTSQLISQIKEETNISFAPKFFRLNLNISGIYLAKKVYFLLRDKHSSIENERKAKARYNQEQYEAYRAGFLGS